MYWPLGAPRVYAASRRKRKPPEIAEETEKGDLEAAAEDIRGLRVARNSHLFVTITETALTVWQTAVGGNPWDIDWF
jgi:hypothetical protein